MNRRLVVAACVLAVSCRELAAPPASTAGTWRGIVGNNAVVLNLVESDGLVTGTGKVTGKDGRSHADLPLEVSGTSSNEVVTLKLTTSGSLTMTAALTGVWLIGTVNGLTAGHPDNAVLTKQ